MPGPAESVIDLDEFESVPANPAAGPRGNLHLYRPGGPGPFPFILGIHGGGWNSGDQSAYAWLWPKVRPLRIGLALASYRLAPAHPFPAAYDDLAEVLAWLKSNGDRHGLDTDRCLLFGGSAGGHLAMLVAARATAERLVRPRIRGVASYCGIMDPEMQLRWDLRRSNSMTSDFLPGGPDAAAGLYQSASPIKSAHAGMPPAWIAHGSADPVVSADQSRAMAARLRTFGHRPVHLEARGLGHTMLETTEAGEDHKPLEMLFEKDFLRFVQRCLLR